MSAGEPQDIFGVGRVNPIRHIIVDNGNEYRSGRSRYQVHILAVFLANQCQPVAAVVDEPLFLRVDPVAGNLRHKSGTTQVDLQRSLHHGDRKLCLRIDQIQCQTAFVMHIFPKGSHTTHSESRSFFDIYPFTQYAFPVVVLNKSTHGCKDIPLLPVLHRDLVRSVQGAVVYPAGVPIGIDDCHTQPVFSRSGTVGNGKRQSDPRRGIHIEVHLVFCLRGIDSCPLAVNQFNLHSSVKDLCIQFTDGQEQPVLLTGKKSAVQLRVGCELIGRCLRRQFQIVDFPICHLHHHSRCLLHPYPRSQYAVFLQPGHNGRQRVSAVGQCRKVERKGYLLVYNGP